MQDDVFEEAPAYSGKRKFKLELFDLLAGCAYPLILMVLLSSTIIMFADSDDMSIKLLALIGGEVMTAGALMIFGRANGVAAYGKTAEYSRKKLIGSTDEKVAYGTGEYALWKGAAIGLIVCIPYLIIQTVGVIYKNTFCDFCLKYIFGWAYYPFSFLGDSYVALGYIMILFPVGVHTLAYYLGKLKGIKVQEQLDKTNPDNKRKAK